MQAVVKTPHIDLKIKGSIPDNLIEVLKNNFGKALKLKNSKSDMYMDVFETSWYKNIKKGLTPGKNLRIYRENHKLSQTKLGEKLGGFSRQYVSDMENGKRNISLKTAKVLAKIFKVSIEKFIQ